MVLGRRIRVKIVRKPVAIVSADSRVVCLTAVNSAISSSKSPPAALNAPPARLITTLRSEASTANEPATLLIEPSCASSFPTPIPNWFKTAMAVSAVSAIFSNVGASSVLARAASAILVSLADKPA